MLIHFHLNIMMLSNSLSEADQFENYLCAVMMILSLLGLEKTLNSKQHGIQKSAYTYTLARQNHCTGLS